MRGMLLDRACRDYRGNGVLEDQLLLITGFENQRVFIEALDAARKFYATKQVDGDKTLVLARIIEKAILYVLRWFIHPDAPCDNALKSFEKAAGPIAL